MLHLRCARHPRYNGASSPRASCWSCIALWEIRTRALKGHVEIVESHHPAVAEEHACAKAEQTR